MTSETETKTRTADRAETISGRPESGIVYVYRFLDDGTAVSLPCEQVKDALSAHGGWTWVHIGLADARARTWIAGHAPVSDMAREVLAGTDEHIRLDILGSEIIGVMPDLHQMFAQPSEDIVRLRFVMTDRMLITARRTPVHSLELTRRSIETGRRYPTPIAFLDGIIDQFADVIGRQSETLADQLDAGRRPPAEGGTGRRTPAARPHPAATGAHASPAHAASPACSSASSRASRRRTSRLPVAIRALAQKLDAIDHDVATQYERSRLLLDEVAGKMAALTNRRLFTLSILTACLLPPTLVTGVFGMNTKDLPFQNTDGGTWYALAIAMAAAAVAYWLLRRLRAL